MEMTRKGGLLGNMGSLFIQVSACHSCAKREGSLQADAQTEMSNSAYTAAVINPKTFCLITLICALKNPAHR